MPIRSNSERNDGIFINKQVQKQRYQLVAIVKNSPKKFRIKFE